MDYDLFKQVANDSELLLGLDNQDDINDNEAYAIAFSVCQEVMNGSKTNKDSMFTLQEYLSLLGQRCRGFSYKIVTKQTGNNKKLQGIMWMTATMRRNFELFGSFISLDMMKRGINKLLFPYTAVTMLDESNKICIACEGIVVGELEDMYKAQAEFLRKFAPGQSLSLQYWQ